MIDLLRVLTKFRVPTMEDLKDKFVYLGERTKMKLLLLDMDETMIHSRFGISPQDEKNDDGDFFLTIPPNERFSVKMRPNLDGCLEHLANFYEIGVFTAGE